MRGRQTAALLIIVALGIGVGLWARSAWVGPPDPATVGAASTATLPPPATSAPPPTAVAKAPTVLPTAVPTPANRDVVLEVSEAELDQELSERLVGQPLGRTPLGEAKIQSVAVQLRDRQVTLGGNAAVGIVQTPFVITGTVEPSGGRPMVDVRQATVGGFLLPSAARDTLAQSLQVQVDHMLSERAVKVRSIDIADGKMRLVGTPNS
jgi:hypothetical protein